MVVGALAYQQTELERLYPRPGVGRVQARGSDETDTPFYAFAGGELADELVRLRTTLVPVVRYGRGVCALNLHPTSANDHAVNDLLWRTVRAGEYNSGTGAGAGAGIGDGLLQARVLAMQIPGALARVLNNLTLDELRGCVAEVAAAVDTGNVDELALADSSGAGAATTLIRLCRATPWKVDVHCAYVRPGDLEQARGRQRARAPSIAVVHLKLFVDYARYRRLWVRRIGVTPGDASRVMMHAITTGVQYNAWNTVEAALMASRRKPTKGNWLARIPRDVIWNNLAPRLLFAACSIDS